jgi:D-alanyl-D-alanine carboxypeptidase/D-alanyl-D-alanine-endopeptidase (penicillin-binding protein 4)
MRNLCAFFILLTACALGAPTAAPAADLSITQRIPHPAPGGVAWSAADRAKLQHDIDRLLETASSLRGAHIGLLVRDTTRGTILYDRNSGDEFQPASNFKLLIGSAALDKLGSAFAFQTAVLASGTIADETLTGDLFLRGGGDAQLLAKDLDDAAAAVAAKGITHVSGSVIGDESRYDDQRFPVGWDWDDLAYYYAPAVSALDLEENVLHVYMTPGSASGDSVSLRVAPLTSAFMLENRMTTGDAKSKDTSDVVRLWDQPRTVRLIGFYPLGAKESDDLAVAVPDPAEYAVDVFTKALAAHGISVGGGQQTGGQIPAGATPLWSHRSEPMPMLMADFWWESDNLMGELFLKELSVANGSTPGSTDKGAAFESTWLKALGVDPLTVSISDGSGLSNYDRITPRALVAILQHDWNGPNRNVVLEALPVAGVSGTLRTAYVGTAAEKNVWAKTGSISHVRTMSGFIRTRRHGAVTFSFLLNDWMEDGAGASDALAKLRAALFSRIVTD